LCLHEGVYCTLPIAKVRRGLAITSLRPTSAR
jgi:hypothetical protein